MLSIFSSCARIRAAFQTTPAASLIAIFCCGIAFCQEPSELPVIELKTSTIELEAPVEKACVGGRGRFLIASLRDRREVVVVDLVRRFVSFTIPLGEEVVELAAGTTHLHVVAPDSGLFQSWDLRTGERYRETAWPLTGHVKNIAMGSGNNRRLAVCFADSPHAKEPVQWATIELPSMEVQRLAIEDDSPATDFQLQASTDGTVFVARSSTSTPHYRGIVLIDPLHAEWLTWPDAPKNIRPNESGSRLFTDTGVFTLQLAKDQSTGMEGIARCVPALTGPMYLTQRSHDEANTWTLRSFDRPSALATIRFDKHFSDRDANAVPKLGRPLLFSVEGRYFVTLKDDTEVVLHHFNASELTMDD
ncbi:hypothetical protein FHS27_006361 [Rhodopirellula rubra]|uniref:Uncharacterized protein n=1 Tax=Aporhodopirellula rubra TaxID=980271 RepID=A0A7W5E6A3_9BACT|nr:hypothetical protein [Aporhodopirellula rubra]MBB3210514.1 hypothetical protein [Aporhodopirellula rubra]